MAGGPLAHSLVCRVATRPLHMLQARKGCRVLAPAVGCKQEQRVALEAWPHCGSRSPYPLLNLTPPSSPTLVSFDFNDHR